MSAADHARRIFAMVSRAIVTAVDDTPELQSLQVEPQEDELLDDIERFGQYGFTSKPYPEAEAIMLSVGGLRSHSVVIAVEDRRFRLTGLEEGEVALYDDLGQVVHLKRDGIYIQTDQKITIEGDSVEVTAETVTVDASTATITADTVNLGGTGGKKVARVGDSVDPATHKIIEGSGKVFAA